MHRIELIADTQPMFHIPGKLHLTWEAPGPVDVDLSKFTEQEKNWLRNGKLRNVLKITNLNPGSEDKELDTVTDPQAKQEQTAEDIKAKAEQARLKREADAKKTLTAPMAALTRFIEKCGDPLQLRIMKEQELVGKNRAKVIKLLDDRLAAISVNIGNLVGTALGEDAIANEANLPQVEEQVEGSVTIKLGAEE